MTDLHKSTRLGDLLVERNIITRTQLLQAIGLQQARRLAAVHGNNPEPYRQELGEVLIELGFINRAQLKTGLGWQRRLRKATAAVVLIAPMLTACGGGGGASPSSYTPPGSQAAQPLSSASDSPDLPWVPVTYSSSQAMSSVPVMDAPSSAITSSPKAQSSSSVASSELAQIDGPVQIYWNPPNERENGDPLDITEIGGYELRYKRKSDVEYTRITINDGYADAYYFDYLQGEYEFQIAAFDTSGLYSTFAPIKASHNSR